jgi:CheY-like chemotaxis protein
VTGSGAGSHRGWRAYIRLCPTIHARVPEGCVGKSLPATGAGKAFPVFPTPFAEETANIASMTGSVLVVDDDPDFRKLAGRLLSASGLDVAGEADSVAAGRAAAARIEPSAILIDVELPDGDGLTLARELAALPWRPRIVVTSIDPDITTPHEARNAGARAFVNKADLPNAPLAELLGGE